jgi:hypothetical protein
MQAMVKTVQHSGGRAELTLYPELGHNSWEVTYENPELYHWMLQFQTVQPATGCCCCRPQTGLFGNRRCKPRQIRRLFSLPGRR